MDLKSKKREEFSIVELKRYSTTNTERDLEFKKDISSLLRKLPESTVTVFIPLKTAQITEELSRKEIVIFKRHPNGGGWVESSAFVDPMFIVSKDSIVFGNSELIGAGSINGTVLENVKLRSGASGSIKQF